MIQDLPEAEQFAKRLVAMKEMDLEGIFLALKGKSDIGDLFLSYIALKALGARNLDIDEKTLKKLLNKHSPEFRESSRGEQQLWIEELCKIS